MKFISTVASFSMGKKIKKMKTSDFNVCSFSFQFLAWQLFLLVNIFRSYQFLKWKHFPQFLRKADWSGFLQSKTHFYHGKRFKAPNNRNSDTGKMKMKPSIYVFRCWEMRFRDYLEKKTLLELIWKRTIGFLPSGSSKDGDFQAFFARKSKRRDLGEGVGTR